MIPPEYLNQIVTGDARELAKRIPDESVDLIFTDPIYDRIDDYRWLAETAVRVLKPDRVCLVWCSVKHLPYVLRAMEPIVEYKWTLIEARIGYGVGRYVYGYVNKHAHCLVFGGKPKRLLSDVSYGTLNGNKWGSSHKWNKHPETLIRWINGMSDANDTILDPFTGGGTVPAVCKMLGRNYVAFEIDPDVAEAARERVQNTQPPLFVLEPEQAEMELA